ncbi:MAG TPA: helix-turn-helix domain-containing protein [Stellaceae bacterium]|nr:helix-turn-helix domain-containing protein [Stellaceae bacterium]
MSEIGPILDLRWAKLPIGLAMRHELSARDWRVLIFLLSHANARGENAYPSMATIALGVGIDKADASRSMKRLETFKLIEMERRPGRSAT